MEAVGEELLREILVKLPSRDVATSCCVSRLWRVVVENPSFRSLHGKATHVVAGSDGAQTLSITGNRDDFKGLEMIVLNASLAKPLCVVTDLARSYGPTNACNGFILFASVVKDDPLYVCNPITSEKLKITPPPPPPEIGYMYRCSYAMGFSPSTCQYKLFRHPPSDGPGTQDSYLDVYTLGAGCNGPGWRRSPYTLPRCLLYSTPPVLVDGRLYLVVKRCPDNNNGAPSYMILVIDTASEEHRIYRLPPEVDVAAEVHAFELSGQLCVAVLIPDQKRLCLAGSRKDFSSRASRRLQSEPLGFSNRVAPKI